MSDDQLQVEREAFEAWSIRLGRAYLDPQIGVTFHDVGNGYPSWVAWQARAALDTLAADNARLRAELEEARRDAGRYNAFFDAGLPITFLGVEYRTKADLDAAIDAALGAKP